MRNLAERDSRSQALIEIKFRSILRFTPTLGIWLLVVTCGPLGWGQAKAPAAIPDAGGVQPEATLNSVEDQGSYLQAPGSVCGHIVDPSGTAVAGARVKLAHADQFSAGTVQSGSDGQFCIPNVPPGAFELAITAEGFAPQNSSGILRDGESCFLPQIMLTVAAVRTEMRVGVSTVEVAEAQIKDEEKQRLLGVIPNFYVSYVPDAAPLSSKQKFELAWRTLVDPFTFALTGATAGIEQAQNDFSGYGGGAQGYGKRFGAAYANNFTSILIGSAILPSLLKQDPRYFYKGTGRVRSRFLYAIANSVICKGDNGRWQANYSAIVGDLSSGGISNLYYPAQNRDGVTLTFENALIDVGETAAFNVIQEFIFPKLTAHRPDRQSTKP